MTVLDFAKFWTEQPIVVIDFETCGLNPSDGAVEIACVRFEGGHMTSSFTTLLNPGHDVPESATAIHGISTVMVQGAPSLPDAAADILRVCRDAVPCAYSSGFDRGFLHASITGNDCPAFDPAQAWLDPLVIVKDVDRFTSGKGRHKLTEACKRYGVELEGAHRALADATAAGRLLFALLDKGKIKRCPLGKLIAHIEARRIKQDAGFHAWKARQENG